MGKNIHIYCDESRQTKDRYMVLGGLVLSESQVETFNASMAAFRKERNMLAEMKWTKVSNGKLAEYKRFIEYFFALNNTDKAHFHAMILDTTCFDHARFGADGETGFYKFYYQLLLHCFGRYRGKDHSNGLFVRLDYRQSKYSLAELKDILNAGLKKRFQIETSPFTTVEPRESKECDLIQVVDILVGAIGYEKNGYDLISGASESKKAMVRYICEQAGLPSLKHSTTLSCKRFTLWNFRLKK